MNVPLLLLALGPVPVRDLDQDFDSPTWRSHIRGGRVPYHRLVEEDFRIRNNGPSDKQAYTTAFIEYSYQMTVSGSSSATAKIVKLTVRSGFDRNRSWRKSDVPDMRALLNHEQGHLDINELAAHKLASTPLDALPVGRGRSLREAQEDMTEKIRRFFEDANNATKREQERYDAETDGGLRTAAQMRWSQSISKRLRSAGIRPRWRP